MMSLQFFQLPESNSISKKFLAELDPAQLPKFPRAAGPPFHSTQTNALAFTGAGLFG